ncbi:MAG: amino acid permease [Proteobacteria bacterium]|nr:amino acid permease [Pseudomonadota bacterium]
MSAPRRKFGIWLATALVVGNIIGSAIFMLPAGLAPFGWNAVAAWGVTLAGALCLAWVFAELARALPNAGGSYGFMQLGVGEGMAFLGAWGYTVSVWAANAAICVAGVSYLTRLVPSLEGPVAQPVAAIAGTWLLVLVNLRGLRAAGVTQLVTSVVKVLPFAAVVALALYKLATGGLGTLPAIHAGSFTLAGTSGALGLTLYAMLGLESATVPADAVEEPARIVPRATMIGTGFSGVLSLFATCAVALMLPADAVHASNAPVSDFIAPTWGNVAGGFVALCAVVSCFGCLNGWLLVGAELPAAMSGQGTLPPWFGRRNANDTAVNSLLVGAVVTTLLISMAYTKAGVSAYNFGALLATATNLIMYILCPIAVMRFMRDGRVPRSATLWATAIGATLFSVWALYGSGWEALGWGAVLTGGGWPVYLLARRAVARAAALAAAE